MGVVWDYLGVGGLVLELGIKHRVSAIFSGHSNYEQYILALVREIYQLALNLLEDMIKSKSLIKGRQMARSRDLYFLLTFFVFF